MNVEQVSVTEPTDVWTSQYENNWYVGYVTKYDPHYLIVKLEGARSGDQRYRVYVHRSVVTDGTEAVIGTRINLRLRPNRKETGVPWEALEARLAAQSADLENSDD
jgi:hypothetical protein